MTLSKSDVQRQIKEISVIFNALSKELETASVRALNKTAVWTKGRASRKISQKTRVQLKIIRNQMVVSKAYKRNLKAKLDLNKLGIPVVKMGRTFQTKAGVQVGKFFFKSAFIATMKNKHTGVFQRAGKERLPIEEKKVSMKGDAEEIFNNLLENEIPKQFKKYFEHEFEYIMSKK